MALSAVACAETAPRPLDAMRTVADAVLRDVTQPPPFDWGEGVLLAGMLRAYGATGDARYLDFARRWADHWATAGIGPLLRARGYCGHWGPGLPVLMLYEETGEPRYQALAEQIVDFMQREAERTREGGLSHFNGQPQLWVDTLFMACPVYAQAARQLYRPGLQREAERQLAVFAARLRDPGTGLFYHMYDEATDTRTREFWARGNGWVAMSYVETLRHAPARDRGTRRLAAQFQRQLAGIGPFQDPASGLWHTVLNAPETYLETSASAMFVYAIVESQRLALLELPEVAVAAVPRAWAGLAGRVDAQGRVGGVSTGTGPTTKDVYARIATGTETWGTGAFLLAAAALAERGP